MIFKECLDEHKKLFENMGSLSSLVDDSVDLICKSFASGGKLILCGNGGSASDSQHIAAEFLGRFKNSRNPIPALSLAADTATLTCISNDFGYDLIFERQLKAFAKPNDIFLGISTSGQSKNVLNAAIYAKSIGLKSIALLGKGGGEIKKYIDIPIIVPSETTARIQEAHIFLGHMICELSEIKLGVN